MASPCSGRADHPIEPLHAYVPAGGRCLIVSDLHLGALATPTSEAATVEIARFIEAWNGPGLVVLAGDTFELWAEPNNSPAKALRSHPRFSAALGAFASGPDRRVVVLAGNHDGPLGWDDALAGEVRAQLGADVGIAVDVEVATGAGPRRVRVEHGHQLDRFNAFDDPTMAGETPLGQHVVAQVLPGLRSGGRQGTDAQAAHWLDDLNGLSDPAAFPRFVASRLLYRRLARHLRWLALPVLVVALLRLATHLSGIAGLAPMSRVSALGPLIALGVGADLALVLIGLTVAGRRVVAAIAGLTFGPQGSGPRGDRNATVRARAVRLGEDGYAGYVTGHTHSPELVDLGTAFYANAGCNADALEELPARAGLPSVFRPTRRSGWLELEAGATLHARLWLSQVPLDRGSGLERLAARRTAALPARPEAVAALAPATQWPAPQVDNHGRRARRLAAAVVAIVGVVDVVSSLTPPIRARARGLMHLVGWGLPETATIASAALGVALLLLAGGVRRGQRRAWLIALAALGVSALANVAKGLDIEEALLSLGALSYLASRGRCFRGRSNAASTRWAAVVLAGTAVGTMATAALVAVLTSRPVPRVLGSFAGRLVGLPVGRLPHSLRLVSAAVAAVAVASLCGALWLLLRPRRLPQADPDVDERAWNLVRRHGRGTLDYFALRDDKARFVTGNTVVAYAVRAGVAVVAPDPIGPPDERSAAWTSFRRHAADNGWSVAVLGASEEWLGTYRRAGMTTIYAGDEALVDVERFSLDGGRNKSLRQAVNRLERAGYQVTFCNPAELDETRSAELRDMMGASRKGDVERGFSMTLSRIFDPRDTDLLLAIASGPDGQAAAFCQFVPAAGIDGYSLDLMRRSGGDHPNGLTDYVVVRTIEELRRRGRRGLGLNFATMRAVLAGDVDDSWLTRRQRWLLQRLGQDMQIETLWRFNAKYDPTWLPRYIVIDGPDQALSAGLAMAAAESLWELPVIGRFLRPTARQA